MESKAKLVIEEFDGLKGKTWKQNVKDIAKTLKTGSAKFEVEVRNDKLYLGLSQPIGGVFHGNQVVKVEYPTGVMSYNKLKKVMQSLLNNPQIKKAAQSFSAFSDGFRKHSASRAGRKLAVWPGGRG